MLLPAAAAGRPHFTWETTVLGKHYSVGKQNCVGHWSVLCVAYMSLWLYLECELSRAFLEDSTFP